MFSTSASYPSDGLISSGYFGGPPTTTSTSQQLASMAAPGAVQCSNPYHSSITLPPTPAVSSNLLSTNASSFIGLNRMSPLPKRRYSYSGLPSTPSMNDLHMSMNMNCAMVHENSIANLISETCQSISRTSDILNRQLSSDLALSCTSLSNLIEENIESDIVKYDLLNDITTTAAMTPLKYANNLYTQPAKYNLMPTAIKPSYFNRNPSHYLSSDDYILSKPIFSKNYINPISSSYICDDHNTSYNNYPTTTLATTHYHSPPSHYHYHSPHPNYHYASNPCLSSHHSYHNSPRHSYPISNTNAFNRNYNYQSHHQQAFSSSRPPSISSLNRYNTTTPGNYPGSYNQPYYRTSSRMDLDNPKGGEIKRQVSFKFDVDQMSFDP